MKPKVLLFWGGWDGHSPETFANIIATELTARGLDVQVESTLDCLNDLEALRQYTLIIPFWTMGKLTDAQTKNLLTAVREGVNLGGMHGGAGDAFRGNVEYEWMVGGIFAAHPHIGDYTVNIKDFASPITRGLPDTFPYKSEQYYMLVDPGVHVLADTQYIHEGHVSTIPVAWIKRWGKGRVFYTSLGHAPSEFTDYPQAPKLLVQGLLWAAGLL
jgi:type 1 glutamine amidotransferase